MQVSFRILGEVEVYDDVDCLNIDTTGEKVRAYKIAANAFAEVVEDAVTVGLQHLRMRIETRITEFSDLLCKKLDTVG